ncbi:MAG: glucokinase [Acidobacteriaceae bacterium]|jgi:glucokinase|nr:glucokinase [Acidobacteriaceae bacterium]
MILAGDVGGTKTMIGLFDAQPIHPRPLVTRTFTTTDFPDLTTLIAAFANDPHVSGTSVSAACFGIAGPVLGDTAALTNVPFTIDARNIARAFDIPRVTLLNDLEAMAYSLPLLNRSELHVLQEGRPAPDGNLALIAAGTGLGEAFIHRVNGRFIPSATEAGHADWAARNEREIGVLRGLLDRFSRVEVERVVSGRGLVNIHPLLHHGDCLAVDDLSHPKAAALITQAALERRCGGCIETLALFASAYGAEAGNLALRTMATAGVYVGGGIAPKILPALTDGRFLSAFRDKAPYTDLLAEIPVTVILTPDAALLGAAHAAINERVLMPAQETPARSRRTAHGAA